MIHIGPDTFAARPELSSFVAQIIAGWAQVDVSLAEVFAAYAHLGFEIALNVYNAVGSFGTQRSMLDAAAQTVLQADDLQIYFATMKYVKRRYDTRNEMAHWLWGYSDDFPDGLFIIEPKAARKARMFYRGLRTFKDIPMWMKYLEELDDKSFLYRKADLQEHAREMHRAEILSAHLIGLLGKGEEAEEARKYLLSEQQIAEDYGRSKSQVSQPK